LLGTDTATPRYCAEVCIGWERICVRKSGLCYYFGLLFFPN
jgi:hypothetical protein